jgi:hypothetical protein
MRPRAPEQLPAKVGQWINVPFTVSVSVFD